VLVASLGGGAVVAAVFVVGWGSRVARTRVAAFGLCLYTVGLIGIPLSRHYGVGLAAFFLVGLAHMCVATSLNTFLQSSLPHEMRGRALSFYLLGILIGTAGGSMVLAALSDSYGMRATLGVNAVLFGVLIALVLRSRSYARLDEVEI